MPGLPPGTPRPLVAADPDAGVSTDRRTAVQPLAVRRAGAVVVDRHSDTTPRLRRSTLDNKSVIDRLPATTLQRI